MGFADKASNADRRYTCPACYTDQDDKREGTRSCENPECEALIACYVESVPQYTAEVVHGATIGEDDDD